jgi:hypothetical protein
MTVELRTSISRMLLMLMFLAGSARHAWAQLGCVGATCTVEITMPVTDVLRLSLDATGVSLGSPTESDYLAGYRDIAGVSVTAKGNRAFQVQVGGVSGAFTYAGPLADPGKPASDLRWATSAAGLGSTTNHMGTSSMLFNQGAGAITTALFLRTLWSFTTDVPGTYSLAIRFTFSAP